jgi:hypothetical protein
MTPRSTKDAPFCWQSKEALRCIRDWFDESNNVASALATYLALSEIESNTGSAGAFTVTQSEIAKRAGVGQRTVRTILLGLKACHLLKVSSNFYDGGHFRAPSTYELLRSAPTGNSCRTIGNNFQSVGNERLRRQLPGNTRKREESLEEISKKERSKGKAVSVGEAVAHAESLGLEADDGRWFFEKCEGSGWTNGGKPIRGWRMTMSSWNRVGSIFPSHKRQHSAPPPPHSGFSQPLRMVDV